MHNNNGKNNSSMMWMMLICTLPLVILLFAGGKLFGAGYLWPILIGAFVVGHLVMMFRGHGGRDNDDTEEKSDTAETQDPTNAARPPVQQAKAKSEHTHGGCCH